MVYLLKKLVPVTDCMWAKLLNVKAHLKSHFAESLIGENLREVIKLWKLETLRADDLIFLPKKKKDRSGTWLQEPRRRGAAAMPGCQLGRGKDAGASTRTRH